MPELNTRRVAVLVTAVLVGVGLAFVLRDGPSPVEPVRTVRQVAAEPVWLDVRSTDDTGKAGTGRSVMGQLVLEQAPRTSGPSPDSLRFRFDAPVEITGVLISVDIWGPSLVEVVAGVNVEHPYGIASSGEGGQKFAGRDWLLHTSDSNDGGPSKIDEQIVLPVPVELAAGDWVAVDVWLGNHTTTVQGVSPEVILFYRWL